MDLILNLFTLHFWKSAPIAVRRSAKVEPADTDMGVEFAAKAFPTVVPGVMDRGAQMSFETTLMLFRVMDF